MALDIPAIRESFERLRPISSQLATRFYSHLWADHPEAKGLFTEVNMEKQKVLLMKSLATVVESLDQADRLAAYLKQMGSRHVGYGALSEHYPWVGSALLATLKDFLGESWTPYLESQWTQAYAFIADTMLNGAAERTDIEPPSENARKAQPLTAGWEEQVNDLVIDVPREMRALIRTKVRQKVRQIIRKEIEEAMAAERRELEDTDIEAYSRKVG